MSFRTNLFSRGLSAWKFALPVLALGVGTTVASAEQLYRGMINIPVEARWEGTVIKPGTYAISVESNVGGARLLYLRGEKKQFAILAGSSEPEGRAENAKLTLVNVGGTYVVKRFDAGYLGTSFSFKTPKGLSNEPLAAAATETSVEVTGSR